MRKPKTKQIANIKGMKLDVFDIIEFSAGFAIGVIANVLGSYVYDSIQKRKEIKT
jgi:uncharacterized membrane protein YjfL (UPF0719 family)